MLRQEPTQIIYIDRAGPQDFRGSRIVEHGQQQMLDGDEFMALLPRFHERHVQTD